MGDINIANPKGRDAVVALESVASVEPIRWLDESGRQASSSRFVKATLDHSIDALLDKCGSLQAVGAALLEGDPEIDLSNTGRRLKETARVFVDKHGGIVRNVRFWEVIKNPDGSERERRPRQLAEQNVSTDTPLKWSGVFVPKHLAVRKFVFTSKAQIQHVNGLTYDFLYAMARDLEERNSLMLLGSGPKSNQPLVLRRGGTPYRGFLEGRTSGDKYCLLLHFSNLELKSVAPASIDEPTNRTGKKPVAKSSRTDSSAVNEGEIAKKQLAAATGSLGDSAAAEAPTVRKAAKTKVARTKGAKKRATKKTSAESDSAGPGKKKAAAKTAKKKSKTTTGLTRSPAAKKTATKKSSDR